jgi:hypothetical protein
MQEYVENNDIPPESPVVVAIKELKEGKTDKAKQFLTERLADLRKYAGSPQYHELSGNLKASMELSQADAEFYENLLSNIE